MLDGETARPNGISFRGRNMVGTKDARARKAASDPRREIRIGKRAWSRLAGIFRFRGRVSLRRAGRAVCQIGRRRERWAAGCGRIRKYVAAAQHVARNLGRLAAGDI